MNRTCVIHIEYNTELDCNVNIPICSPSFVVLLLDSVGAPSHLSAVFPRQLLPARRARAMDVTIPAHFQYQNKLKLRNGRKNWSIRAAIWAHKQGATLHSKIYLEISSALYKFSDEDQRLFVRIFS